MNTFLTVPLAALAAAAISQPAWAEQVFVDDAAACAQLGTEDGLLDFAGNGGLILNAQGFNSLEYYCAFTPDLEFHWGSYKVTTHVGQCEQPGPYYYPMLFTFVMSPDAPGVVTLFDGSGEEPVAFHACGQ